MRRCSNTLPENNFQELRFQSNSGRVSGASRFSELALEGIDLLRYIIKLFFSQRSCSCNLLDSAIRFAHCSPNSHRNSSELTLSGHRSPPFGIEPSYTRTIPRVINLNRIVRKNPAEAPAQETVLPRNNLGEAGLGKGQFADALSGRGKNRVA